MYAKYVRSIFKCLSVIIFGTLADLYGRKIILIFCLVFFVVGIIITPQANSFYKLVAGYSIETFGLAGVVLLNYILFLELCHNDARGILVIYLTFFATGGKLTGRVLKSHMADLTDAYYLFAMPTLSMLFYIYFVPESPRWYLSYGKKRKAWKILQNWGEDITRHTFLPELKLSKPQIFVDNLRVLFCMTRYRKTVLIMTWLRLAELIVIENMFRYVKIHNLTAGSHKFAIFMAEIFSFFNVLPPFILFGRYISLFFLLATGTILQFISICITNDTGWYLANILSVQYYYALEYIGILYSAELLPTAARGTGLGLIMGVGELLSTITRFAMLQIFSMGVSKRIEEFWILSIQVIAILLLARLPNLRVRELPDWKRYRNIVEI